MRTARRGGTRSAPVYTAVPEPGRPPVAVVRLDHRSATAVGSHVHDFPGLAFFTEGGGTLRLDGRDVPVAAGDVAVVAPGATIGEALPVRPHVRGRGVFFTPDALGPAAGRPPWRAHALLAPFTRPRVLPVPAGDRAAWTARITALEDELAAARPGHRDAVTAHLVLLLVDLARLDGAAPPPVDDDPLLAAVLAAVERGFRGPLSTADVARAVALTPEHLTTRVRRATGRTVGAWITDRRMAEARRLLVETDLAVAEVARRVGVAAPGHFGRVFRRTHGTTPGRWRRAAR